MKALLPIAAATLMIGTSHAAPIVGGQTTLTVVQDLAPLGWTTSASDGAQREFEAAGQPVFTFPIIGGNLDPDLTGEINHGGTISITDGSNTLSLSSLTIDLTDNVVLGDVDSAQTGSLTDQTLFAFTVPAPLPDGEAFDIIDDLTFPLFYTNNTINVIEMVFGQEFGLTEASQFGSIATNPDPVPLPAAALFMVPGAFFMLRRRKA